MKILIILFSLMLFGCDEYAHLEGKKFCWHGKPYSIGHCTEMYCRVVDTTKDIDSPALSTLIEPGVVRVLIQNADKECP